MSRSRLTSLQRANFSNLTTGIYRYDTFLSAEGLKDNQLTKNLTGVTKFMTPDEYINKAAELLNISTAHAIVSRTDPTLQSYVEAMKSGDLFPMPVLDYAYRTQEGLHRMLAAMTAFGNNEEYPVLVITPYDSVEWKKAQQLQVVERYAQNEFVGLVEYAVEQLKDSFSSVPDNIEKRMKDTLEELATYDDHKITVLCEISEHQGEKRLDIFLMSLDGVQRATAVSCIASPWLSDMFMN